MIDRSESLGRRIVEAARLAVRMHLEADLAEAYGYDARQHPAADGVGCAPTDGEPELSPAAAAATAPPRERRAEA